MTNPLSFSALLSKYDVPTPRYTSYPTVPFWDTHSIDDAIWKGQVLKAFEDNEGEISLYLHLPFCEALCTYCGCNKRITKNHAVEIPYIQSLLKEWAMYLELFEGRKPVLKDLHLGGGTPSFFSADNLKVLLETIMESVTLHPQYEFSIEVHPNYTNATQLKVLAALGFKRLSVGVQDFDPAVQLMINRIQTFEQTKAVVDQARAAGFTGINIDIIYGLPSQTLASVKMTIDYVIQLNPDRIAFYSYAHVPWKSAGQRRYSEADLPSGNEKRALYEFGRTALMQFQYKEIGMDHFAKPSDELFVAEDHGVLHRNFMGYTTTSSKFLLGLGVSSISDTWGAFMQNEKEVEAYQTKIEQQQFPIIKGHLLSNEDLIIRQHILNLMCLHQTDIANLTDEMKETIMSRLREFEENALVDIDVWQVKVTTSGKPFVRNIAMCLDQRYWAAVPMQNVFSKSV
jgi:oxygen-independent coproporphyrinogen-3 oxidase